MCCFVQVLDMVSDINPFGSGVRMHLGICWLRLRNINVVPSNAILKKKSFVRYAFMSFLSIQSIENNITAEYGNILYFRYAA